MRQQEITQEKTCPEKVTKKGSNWTNKETLLFVEILIDEEFNFADCLGKRALKRSANEEAYKGILQLHMFQLSCFERRALVLPIFPEIPRFEMILN